MIATLAQCSFDVVPTSQTLGQQYINIVSSSYMFAGKYLLFGDSQLRNIKPTKGNDNIIHYNQRKGRML